MWSFLVFTLTCALAANVEKRSIEIHEHGTVYEQTMTFDLDRNVQVIHVPAHNNIVESTTVFDFNNGIFVESQPGDKRCYVKKIPSTMATMEQNMKGLTSRMELNTGALEASSAPLVNKYFVTLSELKREDLSVVEMREECRGNRIFEVAEVTDSAAIPMKSSFGPISASQGMNGTVGQVRDYCEFHTQCAWQTCTFGSDSCFWTVDCPMSDDKCTDMRHNQNFHINGNPLNCKACFNTVCRNDRYDCHYDWHVACKDGAALKHGIPECTNDSDAGIDCGVLHCPAPSDEDTWKGGKGTFDCLQDNDHPDRVLVNNVCLFTCENGAPYGGGVIQCKEDEASHTTYWDDKTVCT